MLSCCFAREDMWRNASSLPISDRSRSTTLSKSPGLTELYLRECWDSWKFCCFLDMSFNCLMVIMASSNWKWVTQRYLQCCALMYCRKDRLIQFGSRQRLILRMGYPAKTSLQKKRWDGGSRHNGFLNSQSCLVGFSLLRARLDSTGNSRSPMEKMSWSHCLSFLTFCLPAARQFRQLKLSGYVGLRDAFLNNGKEKKSFFQV